MGKYIIKIAIIISLVSFLLNTPLNLYSQNISFFNDYLGNVLVFDNTNIRQIEHLPLKSYKIGNKSLAYEDNSGNFKIYHNNYIHSGSTSIDEYKITNNYVTFSFNNILRVFDNGNIVHLSNSITRYFAGEDLVIWFDDTQKKLRAYYDRKFFDLDDALTTGINEDICVGKNIAAYADSRNYMNIFYNGEIVPLDYSDRIKSLSAGKDIIAYVEEPLSNFQVFYFGEFVELESFEPKSYQTGDGFVAYVDASDYLKVFSNFNIETISFEKPVFYETTDHLLVFGVQNFFRVYYNGKIFTLENYIPSSYLFHNNVLCYIDQLGNLKYFDGTKTETISYESITDFELHGNIVKYKFGVSSENIYFKGKTYKND